MNAKTHIRTAVCLLCCIFLCTAVFLSPARAAESSTPGPLVFTDAEKNYLKSHKTIPVLMYDGFGELFCRHDADTDTYAGIAVDALGLLSERTGLKFEYILAQKDDFPWVYLPAHPDTIAAPFFQNDIIQTPELLMTSTPIVEGNIVTFSRHNEAVALDGSFTLALPVGDLRSEEALRSFFPNAKVLSCDTHQQGLAMVESGEADMALVNEITGAYEIQSPYFKDLQASNVVSITEDMTLGLSKTASPELVSILNKAIDSLSVRDIRQIVVNNAATPYHMSRKEWLYQYRLPLFLLTASALFAAACLRFILRQKKQRRTDRQSLLLAEERHKIDLEYQKKIFHQANFDALTGLYNERFFTENAARRMAESPDETFVFLRLNLRRFKMINELYGEPAGDYVLCRIADYMRAKIGKSGVFGRLYADQFAICLAIDQDTLEKYSDACVGYIEYNGLTIRTEVNVGIYIDSGQCRDVSQALDYAQIALQNREHARNDHYFYYQDSYLETMRSNQEITNSMEKALREEQFQVYLQPQIDVVSRCLVGAEALVRWIHPVKGLIPPDKFISVFESNGFIYQLDSYVCDKVCALLADWKKREKLIPVSINLSRIDLEHPELPAMLQDTLKKHGVSPQYLHLEITESAYVKHPEKTFHTIQQLRDLGFCLEMDDFGSGYSSLNMLKDIPVDILKLDMKFFDGERRMDRGGSIIESIVRLAHSLGIMVVAEGVETEREVNFLRSIQCSIVQGYLYGRPENVAAFEKRLSATAIGRKWIDISSDDSFGNLYWIVEKYHLLLHDDAAIVFDYDPLRDCAVFSYPAENGSYNDVSVRDYTKKLPETSRIHPSFREAIRARLRGGQSGSAALNFQADYEGSGHYKWFRSVFYYYENETIQNRILAIIKEGSA